MEEFNKYIHAFKGMEASNFLKEMAMFFIWAIFILIVIWLVNKAVVRSVSDNTARYRVKKITRLVGYSLIALLAVITFTGKAQYFGVALGLITAGVAFALQEVILSFAGWIAIFSTKAYKPGDRVEINDIRGDVIDIGLTKTTLMEIGAWIDGDNYSGRIVYVSNSNVIKGVIRNYSSDFPFLWDKIVIPVKFGSDTQLATQVILDVAHEHLQEYANYASKDWDVIVSKYLIENANVAPMLTFELTDNWIEFNLRYVVDYKKRRSTKHLLFSGILEAINKTDGKVRLASATFDITEVPDINVRMKTE